MATDGRLDQLPWHAASQLCNLITRVASADTAALMRQLASTFQLGSTSVLSSQPHTNGSIKEPPWHSCLWSVFGQFPPQVSVGTNGWLLAESRLKTRSTQLKTMPIRQSESFRNNNCYNLLEWLQFVLRSHIVSTFTSLKRHKGMCNVAVRLQPHMFCTWIKTRCSQEGRANTWLLVCAWSVLFVSSQLANFEHRAIQHMQWQTWTKQKKKRMVFFFH